MIIIEIVVTLVGALVTALIIIFQRHASALRRQKLEHALEMLELAQKLKCDEINFNTLIRARFAPLCLESKHPVASGAKFLALELFDLIVLVGFTAWTFILISQGLIGWAVISGIFALLGLIMPFVDWRGRKQRNEAMARLMRGMDSYTVIPAAPTPTPAAVAPKPEKKTEVQAESLAVPEVKPKAPKTEVRPETLTVSHVTKEIKEKVPEDSILRRHFLTTLRYEIEAHMPPRPTDSILKRHYDHLLETAFDMRIAQMDA